MRILALVLLAGSLGAACARDRHAAHSGPPQRAFYYWRTTLALSPVERRTVEELGVARIYLRLFDVDRADEANGEANGETTAPQFVAPLAIEDAATLPRTVEVVPVIYVRERALRHLDPAAAALLADGSWRAVEQSMARLGQTAREVQIDCDWTDTTRAAYFDLLRRLGERAHRAQAILSATIRLHQIKFRERTGVPPVERGMLMFYNMGRLDADPEASAIFDPQSARAYLARVGDYPLPLDVALPIWSWVVHVRGDRVQGLLQSTAPDALASKPWLQPVGPHRFKVLAPSFLDGALLRAGDFLDVEETTAATTQSAADMIAPLLAPSAAPRTISLFHLSEKDLAHHETPTLARVFAAFR
jgi:hypothetical protein